MPLDRGLLAGLEASGDVKVVPMDAIDFVVFSDEESHIGTRDLSGCHVVAIVSPLAAILAHIPPTPGPVYIHVDDPEVGKNHVRRMMNLTLNLFHDLQDRGLFPSASAYLVCSTFDGHVILPRQVVLIHQCLDYVELQHETHVYDVPTDPSNPGQGTVMISGPGKDGTPARLYNQDVPIALDTTTL